MNAQVRQLRRERDPAVRAREAELELLRQELVARRGRGQVGRGGAGRGHRGGSVIDTVV